MTRLALYVVLRLAHLTGCAGLGHRWEFTDYRVRCARCGDLREWVVQL